MELGYWKIRGRAQSIRLLLEYTAERYSETFYQCGPAPDYDKSGWLQVKESMGLDFPNLPYLIHDGNRLTQTNAILRYIGRRHDMVGKTEEDHMRLDLLDNQLMDFRNGFSRLCYSADFEKLRPEYIKTALVTIGRFSKFLGEKDWLVGEKPTVVDFLFYELLDCHRILEASLLKTFDNLVRYVKRFEDLPRIKAYMASDRFMRAPLNNTIATFGSE
ncbi:glutathione S-transferase Mu 4-like [Amphibalanus amphitrite]|uniref:glutathione S-transferase Mu 4-like n=1 Tax=Amphibalanus amphitrite TaxID=1232801 RepID=UPI001C92A80E|nr:glutathione S-transferase Mu 4-like [Amphibalanus amphitrite]